MKKKINSLAPKINSGLIKFLTVFLNISDIFNLFSFEKYMAQNSDGHQIFVMDKLTSHVPIGCIRVMPWGVSETKASNQISAYITLCWEGKCAADECEIF